MSNQSWTTNRRWSTPGWKWFRWGKGKSTWPEIQVRQRCKRGKPGIQHLGQHNILHMINGWFAIQSGNCQQSNTLTSFNLPITSESCLWYLGKDWIVCSWLTWDRLQEPIKSLMVISCLWEGWCVGLEAVLRLLRLWGAITTEWSCTVPLTGSDGGSGGDEGWNKKRWGRGSEFEWEIQIFVVERIKWKSEDVLQVFGNKWAFFTFAKELGWFTRNLPKLGEHLSKSYCLRKYPFSSVFVASFCHGQFLKSEFMSCYLFGWTSRLQSLGFFKKKSMFWSQ